MFGRRLNILVGALVLITAVLLVRLAQIQVGWHDRFKREDYTRAAGSRLVDTVRGGIYTRFGTPLAVQSPSFDLAVYYGKLADGGWTAPVSLLCGIPADQLTAQAQRIVRQVERVESRVRERLGRDDVRVAERYEYHRVVEDVPPEVAAAFRTEPDRFPSASVGRRRICAVKVAESTRRWYAHGDLAPHVVGAMSAVSQDTWDALVRRDAAWTMGEPFSEIGARYRMDDRIGISGVEKAFEGLLRGKRGYVLNHLVFGVLQIRKESTAVPPEPGCDVYLTIREDFQAAANAALERAAGDPALDFRSGALVILDARDGSVLAAATYPSYDLSTYRQGFDRLATDPRSPLLFRPLQAALPPGSAYKIVTAVAGLEEGAITPDTAFSCSGSQVFYGRVFRCTSTAGHGALSLEPAIEHSCNVYFYNVGDRLGGPALARWGRLFGLGMPTGVDLPYERPGQVPDPRSPREAVNLAIGQGRLLCSPLQVANMAAVVANGGRLYRPHFFDYARNADGDVVERYEPQFTQVPIRQSTLDVLRRGLRLVVESGTAASTGLGRFRVAGKTGTAELGIAGVNHAWFVGYAPYDDPKIAFAVVNERTSGHGGSHAAPIMAFALEPIWDAVERMP